VINYHPESPHMIEVRRWGGTEAWTAQPGEHHLSSSGEMGGIWRNRGRAPQKLVGVGFIGQGFDSSTYYRRMPDSYAPGAAWIFEGVEDDVIGDFGLVLDGAAGLEIDCYDPQLGTPPQAFLMASSEDLTAFMLEVRENFGAAMPSLGGDELPHVRADLVYVPTANGGAVFSTGSIAWCGSLSHNGYDNSVSRITENVLKRFSDPKPL
jgi:N,N-dimethylformamidase